VLCVGTPYRGSDRPQSGPRPAIATGGNRQRVPPDPGPSCASLFAIIEVGGVSEVAEVLGIGEGTVKTHLHHLFEKTGASRQAELVKLVAGYANVLLG
jgi:hypothetical protein